LCTPENLKTLKSTSRLNNILERIKRPKSTLMNLTLNKSAKYYSTKNTPKRKPKKQPKSKIFSKNNLQPTIRRKSISMYSKKKPMS
jgi:hypothetical protein